LPDCLGDDWEHSAVVDQITAIEPFRVEISQAALDAERRQAMSFSISTLLIRNLHDVFGENDPARRRAAIDEIFSEDCVFYEPRGVHRGRDAIDRVAGAIKGTHPDFRYQPIAGPRNWAMAGGSNGYRAALVRRQLTPGLISSLPGTAGLPPFISFSTSYPELPPMPKCMTRRLLSQRASAGSKPGSSGTGARRRGGGSGIEERRTIRCSRRILP